MNVEPARSETSAAIELRAADSVVNAIRHDIQNGTLIDGETLPTERDLMKRFDVSRTVIREAIRSLSASGLVQTRPRYRPVIRKPGVDSAMEAVEGIVLHLLTQPGGVRNLFETRALVEAGLVRAAAKDATKDDIERLKLALDRNQNAIDDSELFYETDVAFHAELYNISQNPILPAIHKAYSTWLAPQWLQMPRLQERNQSNFNAHNNIFQAILMRDPDKAEMLLRSHLNSAWDQVRQTFGTS